MYDEVLFSVSEETAQQVGRVDLADLNLQERKHLQEWVLANPAILGPGVEIITSEFDRWQTSEGAPVADRLDVLAIGGDGRLIVVELKRGAAPHTIHMQAVNYAAMVSRLQPEDVADLLAISRSRMGQQTSRDSALTFLETEKLMTLEGIRKPRIVLIASDFPPSVTASVVWLNEQRVDISLIRFRAYRVADKTLVSFSRLYPVPDVEEFTIGRRTDVVGSVDDGDSGAPWDEGAFRRLREQGNAATLAMLDLAAAEDAVPFGVKEIASTAGISEASVRGQLAGLTMRLKNPKYGFAQTSSPVDVNWLAGGVASYTMDPQLAAMWRSVNGSEDAASGAPPGAESAVQPGS